MITLPPVAYGSHLPVLIKIVNMTDGPILEFGTSIFTTPFLHFACSDKKRRLISYESNLDYYNEYKQFENDFHKVVFVKDWDTINFNSHFSVVLIDHEPASRRRFEVSKLANKADYIVIHDTQPRSDQKFLFSMIYDLFRYKKDYTLEKPYTTVLSNFKNLANLL